MDLHRKSICLGKEELVPSEPWLNPTFLWLWLQQLVVQLLLQNHTEEGDHSLSYGDKFLFQGHPHLYIKGLWLSGLLPTVLVLPWPYGPHKTTKCRAVMLLIPGHAR